VKPLSRLLKNGNSCQIFDETLPTSGPAPPRQLLGISPARASVDPLRTPEIAELRNNIKLLKLNIFYNKF
jgi:hypothetical protein